MPSEVFRRWGYLHGTQSPQRGGRASISSGASVPPIGAAVALLGTSKLFTNTASKLVEIKVLAGLRNIYPRERAQYRRFQRPPVITNVWVDLFVVRAIDNAVVSLLTLSHAVVPEGPNGSVGGILSRSLLGGIYHPPAFCRVW